LVFKFSPLNVEPLFLSRLAPGRLLECRVELR
jgi:hypothetical protein